MSDYRLMFDNRYLRAFHLGGLGGSDVDLTIERVEAGEIETIENGKRGVKRVPLVYFRGYGQPLGLNKTNGKSFARLYGTDTTRWPGKRVTLYVTTCTNTTGEEVECVRVRPNAPKADEVAELLAKPNKKVA